MIFENSWLRELQECLRVFHDFVGKFKTTKHNTVFKRIISGDEKQFDYINVDGNTYWKKKRNIPLSTSSNHTMPEGDAIAYVSIVSRNVFYNACHFKSGRKMLNYCS